MEKSDRILLGKRKRKKSNQNEVSIKKFRSSILNMKKVLMPQMQFGNSILQEIDDFSSHVMEIFEEELILLQAKTKHKTVSVRDLETILKLLLPNNLSASQFAKTSIDNFFKINVEPEILTEEYYVSIEESIPENSIQETTVSSFANKSTDNCSKVNSEPENSAEEYDVFTEESIPEYSNQATTALNFAKKSLDNCFKMILGSENSTEEYDVPAEKSILENYNQATASSKFAKELIDNRFILNLESENSEEVSTQESIPVNFNQATTASTFAKKSTDSCFKMNPYLENPAEVYDIPTEESIPENSIQATIASKFAKKLIDNCFQMNLEPENSVECDVPIEELIPKSSNQAKEKPKSKNKRKALSSTNFKTYILRKKKELLPQLQLEKLTLQEIDDFLNHIMETFFEDIHVLQRRKKRKTLNINVLEAVLKLCIPKRQADSASEFAKKAVDSYFHQM